MEGLSQWIANLFQGFFMTAKKEKKRLDKKTIRASPKTILNS
jgi:hypothetical protein